jgi:hypothetical protein
MSLALIMLAVSGAAQDAVAPFRPPAVPLVTLDPYTSVWSFADRLYDAWPMHWTGAVQAMSGMIRIDGRALRFMGPEALCKEAMTQDWCEVRPTQTVYLFEGQGIELTVTFTTPMLPESLAILSCPVTFITYDVRATDGKEHDVAVYFDATAEWVVNEAKQEVVWERKDGPLGMTVLRFGSKDQPVLEKSGDGIRIDWGYFYVALPKDSWQAAIDGAERARGRFRDSGKVAKTDDSRQPRAANDDWPVIACALPLGEVGDQLIRRFLILAYDDIYSIEYMHTKLRPWWWKEYGSFEQMLEYCARHCGSLVRKCEVLDAELAGDARRIGGNRYADLIGLSYRHVFASGKIVAGPNGEPWYFNKECFSNGCVDTVDVSYPASPFFALFEPALLKGMTEPVFEFAASDKWKWPFSPHDVGQYPKANGQVYNPTKLEGQMPVEECGNMVIMAALASRAEGNAKFAERHWKLLTQWAEYLKEKGLDPENQLCTDDFAGHLAHNANLSLKAINALGAYAMMCDMLGKQEAASYRDTAKRMACEWVKMADDGDHYRLTFDKPGTWSLKYNLVWDRILDLNLFPPEVAQEEVAYYLKAQNKYGVPLDMRKDYTKSDWLVWSASLVTSKGDFEKLIGPLHRFCQETPDRLPFTDWYDTRTAKCVGFRARPVIGGIFIRLMDDEATWKKWLQRSAMRAQ